MATVTTSHNRHGRKRKHCLCGCDERILSWYGGAISRSNKSKLVLALVGTIAWAIVYIIFVNNSELVGQSLQSIVASQETPHIIGAGCESPSLPRGSVHIVVGGYKYKKPEAGIRFEANHNYLLNLGLTNANIFWYRRVHANEPLRQVQGPCGIQLQERLLLPNHGRDGAALFDHILEIYDKPPPKSIIFLHGHAAHAWHTSCESVFARTTCVSRFSRKLLPHEQPAQNHRHESHRHRAIPYDDAYQYY